MPEDSPQDSYAYLVRAKALADERRVAEAREAVDWALAHAGPGDVDVLVLAGVILLMVGDAHAALSVALRAADAEPDSWEAQVLRADACRILDRIPDAVAAARRAVALAPDEAEAYVALWRALARTRKGHAELAGTARRAVELGADPEQFGSSRWWLHYIPLVVAAVMIRYVHGWALAAALAGGAGLAAALWVVQARSSGSTPSGRLLSMRALARAELDRDPAKARIAALGTTSVLSFLPLTTTGFACAAGGDGAPWSTWAVGAAAGGAVVAVLVGARAVGWWYGTAFLRRDIPASGFAALQLGVVGVLVGCSVALSLLGTTSVGWWTALAAAHFLWVFVGFGLTVVGLRRERRRRAAPQM
ncbi:MAG: hypothetical protein QOF44_3496 [Streptomyces sp.]|nr:hypothetical protein [Streptomyces sp.]